MHNDSDSYHKLYGAFSEFLHTHSQSHLALFFISAYVFFVLQSWQITLINGEEIELNWIPWYFKLGSNFIQALNRNSTASSKGTAMSLSRISRQLPAPLNSDTKPMRPVFVSLHSRLPVYEVPCKAKELAYHLWMHRGVTKQRRQSCTRYSYNHPLNSLPSN